MKQEIILNQKDIHAALTAYMSSKGVELDTNAEINFKNGRKGNGPTCTITVDTDPQPVEENQPEVAEAVPSEPVEETATQDQVAEEAQEEPSGAAVQDDELDDL